MSDPLPRTPEPETTDDPSEAEAYDRMDHAAVNEAFVAEFLELVRQSPSAAKLRDGVNPLRILDVGTGPARIPIALGRRPIFARMTLTDLDPAMAALARRNVTASGLHGGTSVQRADGRRLPFRDGTFDAVISNSLLHHLPEPGAVLAEMRRVLRPGGVLFVRDLFRPASAEQVEPLVGQYGGETERGGELLRASLHAALTADELREACAAAGLPAEWVQVTGDRHLTLAGVRAG